MKRDLKATYVIITGAGTARRMPGIISHLADQVPQLMSVLTDNACRIVSPRELALVEGHTVVESYFDDVILPQPPDGVVLVAPCTFNSLNKLAQGIADTLALSITAEAIGRGTPVIVAVSVNYPLWRHPRTQQSISTLRSWGVTILGPAIEGEYATMLPDRTIIETVVNAFD